MQQVAEVADEGWLGSLPGTMQDEAEEQMDTVEACEMMNEKCEDGGVNELNL